MFGFTICQACFMNRGLTKGVFELSAQEIGKNAAFIIVSEIVK